MNSRDPVVRPGVDVHQYYTLDMPQVKSAALADIFSFTGTRGMCEPTKYMIQFTHPRHDLSRSEYLNHMAAFVMQPPAPTRWSQPEAPHRVPGVITSFAHLSDTRDQAVYEVVLESRLALLRNTPRYRHFIDRRIPEIIEQILRENDFDQILADYLFNLYRTYRKWEFVVQWGEDDLTFITRLCRMSGIWFVCEQGKRCEVVRFGDDFTYYTRNPEKLTVPLLEPSGLVTGGRESVKSLEMHSEVIPANYVVRSYSPEEGAVEPVDGRKFVYDDRTTYGEAYTWGTPYLGKVQAEEEALLRQEAALAAQITYTGTCDMLDLAPSCVLKLSNRDLPDAKYGLLAVRVTCSASRKQGYKVDFTAIPSDRQYRHPLEEHTWPRIEGVVTGTIASTKGYVGPYLDEQGRYIVHIHADRDQRTPGLESCPMRLAKPFGGPGQTGFHFGLEPGAVVTVAFLWGNPNLPFISQVLHTVQDTDPIHSGHPQARIFRPIPSTSDAMLDAVRTLLKAEQAPPGRIKHLWLSRLTKQGHNASIAAVKDAGLTLAVHKVDDAIGKPGPVSTLLLQTLAAQMVQHGQGVQLVASPSADGLTLNLVGTQEVPVKDAPDFIYPPCIMSLSFTLVFGWAFLVFLGVETGNVNPTLFWVSFGLVFLSFFVQMGFALWKVWTVDEWFGTRL
ncbi:type VI secretion system Vgr family protein [Paraburkholderia heleia]|uniref:type VI secretion system Vgr family protein n=1 Tax=Paraburkholderia heleia TaxID=634127 RepID=UPI002AB786D5|nr:type VI secretion system tip protein VgrG [Paraburkholderia heleia]